jgi:hypothetical protein
MYMKKLIEKFQEKLNSFNIKNICIKKNALFSPPKIPPSLFSSGKVDAKNSEKAQLVRYLRKFFNTTRIFSNSF